MASTSARETGNIDSLPPEDTRTTPRSKITFGPLGVARCFVNLFSTNANQRKPPSASKTRPIRLITIGVSHYCEKVRWGLDLVEGDQDSPLYYTEDAHPPPFCSFATLPASNDRASSTPMIVDSSLPLSYVNKSNVILSGYCPCLYPSDIRQEVEELEADLGRRLGPSVRCLAYHYLLRPEYESACSQVCCYGSSKVETIVFEKMLHKGVDKAMRRILQVNEATAAASHDEIVQVFDEISNRLEQQQQQQRSTGNGTCYLMDTVTTSSFGFTAADLTFAALAYPLIRPPEMAHFCVTDDSRLPPELVTLGEQLRKTTAGKHVMEMYKQHRIPKTYFLSSGADGLDNDDDGLVYIKSAERNVNPFPSLWTIGVVAGVASFAASVVWCRRQ